MSLATTPTSRPRRSRRPAWPLAVVAMGWMGWWLWPRPPAPAPRPPERVMPTMASTVGAEIVSPVVADASATTAGAPTPLGAFQREVLALASDYEARREADDPVGADAARLRFEALLNDESAALLVRTLPAAFLDTFFGDLALRRWAAADRAAAAAWMARHPVDSAVPAAALAQDWVTNDAAGLNAYLDALPASPWKHLVAKAAGEEALVANRPGETLALLNKIAGDDARRDELREWAVTKWALAAPADAATWAASTAAIDPARGEGLLAAAAVGYANVAPAEAANWAMRTLADPSALHATLPSIARVWAAKEPLAAADWVTTLPVGATRNEAMDGLLSVWAFSDLSRAREWSGTLADAATRERTGRVLDILETQVKGDGPAPFSVP